jgi:hypothetical protein
MKTEGFWRAKSPSDEDAGNPDAGSIRVSEDDARQPWGPMGREGIRRKLAAARTR